MTKLLIAGAGRIGHAVARLLAPYPEYTVKIADRDRATLDEIASPRIEAIVADLTNQQLVRSLLKDVDVVVSACPFYMNPLIAREAVEQRVHYFDLTEDRSTTRCVRELAGPARSALIPQCGLAPGFVSIAAYELAQRFDSLQSLCLRVGAIPRFPSNALKYNLTWSTEGLINEYCNPCEAIVGGERRELRALEGHEQFALDGVHYEAFNTSGGLGSLCDTLHRKLDELSYKTIRYPGHRELVSFLLDDLRLRDRRDVVQTVFEHALPATAEDVVLVFITACGMRAGQLREETYVNRVLHREIDGRPMAAIELTTASAVCTMVDLLAEGKLPRAGLVRQEEVPLELFMSNRFGRYYN